MTVLTSLPWVTKPLLLLAVFLLVALGALATLTIASGRVAVRRRLEEQLGRGHVVQAGSLRNKEIESAWTRLVNLIEKQGLSLADTKDDQLRAKLIAAGYTAPSAPRIFTLIRLVLTVALPAFFVVLSYMSAKTPGMMKLYLIGSGLALLGLYLPNLFISAKADRRRREILNGFPDALDLMLVCVEAGLGLEAAFGRVGLEMTRSHPLLAEILGTAVLEMRAGRSREDALRRMSERAGMDEIRAFTTLLIQSSKLGSSIAQTLRIYASEMREQRRLRAEEKAHRLPVLISIPLVACMLPVMIGVLMLPAIIRVIRQLMPAMGGG
ncbi:MAG TPA: type II secretion system F family protein [Allosphingosinicella sp.]|uniref:type II secretion system F family protein n=1 Tax=Allosphingosinicella sp. TaxID=2823234 RepID=UPI002EDBA00D